MSPWHDYSGRVSALKLAVFVALFLPGLWVLYLALTDGLGARPYNGAVREVGLWMIRLLFLALAITPLRDYLGLSKLLEVRRMIGVAAFVYAVAHVTLYAGQEGWRLGFVAAEIVKRIYLTIGIVAVIGMGALAVTSTDGWQRRLKSRWRALHRAIYVIAPLAAIHFFMQSKAQVTEPIVMLGFYAWLMAARGWSKWAGRRRATAWALAAIGAAVAALTALGEATYYAFKLGRSPFGLLYVNFADMGFRPAWAIAIAAAAVLTWALSRAATARFSMGSAA